jgi:hypothetical protein
MLTPEQLQEIQRAKVRAKKVLRAATVSKLDGGIMAFFALGALSSFCFGWEGPVLGVALTIVSVNSFRGAAMLNRMERTAPATLAINQLFLAASIILYALYCLRTGLSGNSDLLKQLGGAGMDDGGASPAGPFVSWLLHGGLYWLIYGGLILGTIVAQGLAALYYGSRAKYLNAYLDETPQWVVDLQRAHAP